MNDIYIIIKQAFKKKEIYPKIYPHDSKEITKDNLYKSSTKEQIFIHRDNWGLYYIYKKKLSYNQYIAICVFSDRLCTNYNELKLGFRMLISEMSRVRLFIKDNHNLINGQSIQNQKVNLDIFLRENKDYIDSAFKKSQDIPPIKIDIPKNDIVECIFEDRNSTWITNQIRYGYCNIRITFREEQQSNAIRNHTNSPFLSYFNSNLIKKTAVYLIALLISGALIYLINKNEKQIIPQDTHKISKNDSIFHASKLQKKLPKQSIDKIPRNIDKANKLTNNEELRNNNQYRKIENIKPSIPENYILVPGGRFSYKGNFYEDYRTHNVVIDSFYISIYELTQKEYERVMGKIEKFNYMWLAEDSWHVDKGPRYKEVKGNDIPVRGRLIDFVNYCNKRSYQEGYDGFYIVDGNSIKIKENGNGYRLVTPYEWIYAAYGGKKNVKKKYLGGKDLSEVAWHLGNSKSKPHPVGMKKPNIIGLYDLLGNAPEILQGDKKNKYYVSTVGAYNVSDWNYSQTYDVTYIWESNNLSDLSKWSYGTRIAFIPKRLINNNLKLKYEFIEREWY